MKKKLLIFAVMIIAIVSIFAISVSAATTDEFGTIETLSGISDKGVFGDDGKAGATSRVVLFDGTEFHTYPTYYILSNSASPSLSFDEIKSATGITYEKASIIRIEFPDNVTSLSSMLAGSKTLLEVKFSENSKLTTFGYGTFETCTALETINIPSLTTTLGGHMFNGCSSLTSVTFDENKVLTSIPGALFKACSSLTEVAFPNSVTEIGSNVFDGAKNIETVVLGASFKTMGGYSFAYVGQGDKQVALFVPSTFYKESETISSTLYSWDTNHMKTVTYYFTGTEAEAIAITEKSDNEKIADATIIAWDENKGIGHSDYVISNTYVFVYGYNACDAFYDGKHNYEGTGNCLEGVTCTQCADKITSFTDHNYVETLVYDSVTASGLHNKYCSNASDCAVGKIADAVTNPIFTINEANGFSTNGNGIAFGGYQVNIGALDEYNRVNANAPLNFGIVMMNPEHLTGETFLTDGEVNAQKGFLKAEMSDTRYSNISLLVSGFTGDAKNISLVIALYAYTDGGEVEFIQSQTTACANEKVTKNDGTLYTVTYNSVATPAGNVISELTEYKRKETVA